MSENSNKELIEDPEVQVNTLSEEEKKRKKQQAIKEEVISWIETIVAAVVLAFLINTFIVVNAKVPSGSMENTVMTGDKLFANRLSYVFSEPERFDIVVFKYPDDESLLYIKRIIGLPGETVEIRDGKVYINGSTEPLDDSFIKEKMDGADGVYQVPEGEYFMLGDNRNNSSDSRFWNYKFVKKDKILGKAIIKYYPHIELLSNK